MGFPYVTSLSLHLRFSAPGGAFFACEDSTSNCLPCQQLFVEATKICKFSQPAPGGAEKTLFHFFKIFPPWGNICFPEEYAQPLPRGNGQFAEIRRNSLRNAERGLRLPPVCVKIGLCFKSPGKDVFHDMIKLDISNIWGCVEFADLMAIEKEVSAAHAALAEGSGAGSEFLGWMNLPTREVSSEMARIQAAAEKIRSNSDALVVIGIGGSYLGSRAVIELLQGPNRNLGRGRKGDPQIFYAGNSLSTRHWNELCRLLDEKDFSIAIISKSGTTTEPAVATRALRWMLERKYGTDGARERIYAITDPVKGALRQMANEEGWESFSIPPSVGGRFSVLSPVGLLPMAVAGIDIGRLLSGSLDAKESFQLRSYENPVWLYAAVRNLMLRHGKQIEIFESFEPGFRLFGRWWQQLFGESEGKDGKGLFPATAEFTADLHSLGQLIQQGRRNIFETMLRFDPAEQRFTIGTDVKNLDKLNYLAGKTLDFVDESAYLGTISAHVDGGVPVITMDCGQLDEATVGELIYFLELSCAISAYILGVNPFNQPGVELYKRNMFTLLGKPGYEKM